MSNNLDGHCGTIDLFENADPHLIRQTVDCRKRQGCSFAIMGTRIATGQNWKNWRKLVNSFWRLAELSRKKRSWRATATCRIFGARKSMVF